MSRTREFRRGDAVTVITESGAGRPTYVLVHGIGMGHRYWSDLADSLARAGRAETDRTEPKRPSRNRAPPRDA